MMTTKRLQTTLAKNQLLSLGGSRAVGIRCAEGAVWVTTGDGREFELERGKRLRLQPGGKLLVMGLSQSRVRIAWA